MHEATRVYSDKLVDSADNDAFAKLIAETIKKNCEVSPYFYYADFNTNGSFRPGRPRTEDQFSMLSIRQSSHKKY